MTPSTTRPYTPVDGGLLDEARLKLLTTDLPVSVVIVDSAERIGAFLPQLEELVGDGLVLLEDVHVVHHAGREMR